jgi:hypothetical protein
MRIHCLEGGQPAPLLELKVALKMESIVLSLLQLPDAVLDFVRPCRGKVLGGGVVEGEEPVSP